MQQAITSTGQRRVLVIEDEADIADLMTVHLRDFNADVKHVLDGISGLAAALDQHWDMIVLDLNLPGCDGLDVCRQLRKLRPELPVLIVSARTLESDRVRGLNEGADDYLVKPFGVAEFRARVNALFRRTATKPTASQHALQNDVVSAGNLCLNISERTVHINGQLVKTTVREFDLLLQMARSPGRVFKRSELLESVWGHTFEGYLHTVNSHINRLRAKVEEDPSDPCLIQTVWGVGYKLNTGP